MVVRVVVRVVVVLGVVLVVGLAPCQPVAPVGRARLVVGEPGQGGVLGVREAKQTAGQTEAQTSSHQEYLQTVTTSGDRKYGVTEWQAR